MRLTSARIGIGLGAMALLGLCFHGFALDRRDVSLVSYKHTSTAGVDEVHIDDDRLGVVLLRMGKPAGDMSKLDDDGEILPTVNGKATIEFTSPEDNVSREVTYVALLVPEWCQGLQQILPDFLCAARGHIELIRQPPALLSQWGLKRESGYVILGRTSVGVPATVASDVPAAVHPEALPAGGMSFKLPKPIDASLQAAPAEIREAARLTSWLYSKAIRSGPTPRPYNEFLKLPLGQRVSSVQDGSDAVMCAGFRDLWLAAAASSPVMGPVRHAGGYAFNPVLGDLVPFSHAIAEFWVASLQKWVLIDPWFGFSLRRGDQYLGVSDLLAANGDADGIEIVPLTPAVNRFTFNSGSSDSWERMTTTVDKVAPDLDEPTFTNSYQPGYLQYFRSVEFGRAIGAYGEPAQEGAAPDPAEVTTNRTGR